MIKKGLKKRKTWYVESEYDGYPVWYIFDGSLKDLVIKEGSRLKGLSPDGYATFVFENGSKARLL